MCIILVGLAILIAVVVFSPWHSLGCGAGCGMPLLLIFFSFLLLSMWLDSSCDCTDATGCCCWPAEVGQSLCEVERQCYCYFMDGGEDPDAWCVKLEPHCSRFKYPNYILSFFILNFMT